MNETNDQAPRVHHVHEIAPAKPSDIGAIYIGRMPRYGATRWGNPYRVGTHGTREEVIRKFEAYLVESPELMARLPELRGKDLFCHCAPHACHGDVLLRLANASTDD